MNQQQQPPPPAPPSEQSPEEKLAADMAIADIFVDLQNKALETKDTRIQKLADSAFGLLDQAVLKAVLMKSSAERQAAAMAQQAGGPNPFVAQMLNRGKR